MGLLTKLLLVSAAQRLHMQPGSKHLHTEDSTCAHGGQHVCTPMSALPPVYPVAQRGTKWVRCLRRSWWGAGVEASTPTARGERLWGQGVAWPQLTHACLGASKSLVGRLGQGLPRPGIVLESALIGSEFPVCPPSGAFPLSGHHTATEHPHTFLLLPHGPAARSTLSAGKRNLPIGGCRFFLLPVRLISSLHTNGPQLFFRF